MEKLPGFSYNPCNCCGVEVNDITAVRWFGGSMYVYLCPACEGAKYVKVDGFWVLRCAVHCEDIKGLVAYWNALDLYNAKAKELGAKRKRCKKIKRGLDWQQEIQKLRDSYPKE